MALPEHRYYTLKQAAKKVGCDLEDLIHFAVIGVLELCIKIPHDGIFYSYSNDDSDSDSDSDELQIKAISIESSSMIIDIENIIDKRSIPDHFPYERKKLKENQYFYKSNYLHMIESVDVIKRVKHVESWTGMLAIPTSCIHEHEDLLIDDINGEILTDILCPPRAPEQTHHKSYQIGDIYLDDWLKTDLNRLVITSYELDILLNGGQQTQHTGFQNEENGSSLAKKMMTRSGKENFSKQKASLIRSLTELAFAGDGGISKLSIESLATQLQAKFRVYGIEHEDVSPANLRNWLGKPKVK